MKRMISLFILAASLGVSAGLSAQTTFRLPVSSTSEIVQKPVISAPALKPVAPPASATSCPPVLDRQTILEELRNSWAQQFQEIQKAKMAAYNACVSDCIGRFDLSSLPADDPNDPKDFSIATVVGICQETCS
ncbi:MAG TPA: hypothetical protein VFX30_09020 [bacterium]|nr:hypothetical protein [bacterium]